ncbi:bactofilin family protein [Acidocella aromatica]|uniref:Cytoskeletal protein CcmA (Bactofilin family) n=1 Tax=Acidocella aromatica TaxID=1303579 RepID=A0A840VDV5_9PROT|nr:cytoskeletal protein CcmA (bactofilin family) [Acidocella aromatica]
MFVFNKRKTEEPKPAVTTTPAMTTTQAETTTPATTDETVAASAYVPPYFKEPAMARSPFAPPPIPTTPAAPAAPQPVSRPATMSGHATREPAERRTLVVGRGISVQGTVQDAERLVVEGTVEANTINGLAELSIAQGGIFKGEVEVDEAEVAGTIDGTIIARQTLIVRGSGRVLGTARCRRLQVEDGGQITGRIEMLGDSPISSSSSEA